MNAVRYFPGDLVLEDNSDGEVTIGGSKGTIVV